MTELIYHAVERIRTQATARSHHTAMRHCVDGNWIDISWQSFLAQLDALSRAFLHHGINVQDKIAIFANNMPRWMVVDYATMQVRAVSVPIYATNTAKQVNYILQNADIKLLFVGNQQQYDEAIQATENTPLLQKIIAMQVVDLRQHPLGMQWQDFVGNGYPEMADLFKERLAEKNLQDLFTLIYTSGTTGNPKGVMLDHANLAHQLHAHDLAIPNVDANDISLSFLPLSHIFERGWQAYMLHRGVANVYLEDPHQVQEALKIIRPHFMCAVPRFYEKFYGAVMDKVHQAPLLRQGIFRWALWVGKHHYVEKSQGKKASFFHKIQFHWADKLVLSKLREALGGRTKILPCGGAKLDPTVATFCFSIGLNVKIGYGLTETTATVSCGQDGDLNPHSIGTPMPNCQVKIGENNEILVKGGMVMRGYYKNPEASAEAFTTDGFFKTGDMGGLDANGHLYITDRIKELMKTSTGKYIAPQFLEGKIGKDKFIEQIAVIADAKKYVSALIVPCFENLEAHAKSLNLQYKNRVELVKHSEVIKLFEERIHQLQKELPSFEQVKKFTLLPEAFTTKMNEITPTLKLKRKVILERYKKQIEAMYNAHK